MDVRLRLAMTVVSAVLVVAAFLMSSKVRFNVKLDIDIGDRRYQLPTRPSAGPDGREFRVGIKQSKYREQTLTINEPLVPFVTQDHALVVRFKERIDPGSLQLTETSIIAIYDSGLFERIFQGKEAPINVIVARESVFPCVAYAIMGHNELYNRLDCLPLSKHIVDPSVEQLDSKSTTDYPESLTYARVATLAMISSRDSIQEQSAQLELEFMPLKEKLINEQIDAMLTDNNFTHSQFVLEAGGAENLQKFGYFINGTVALTGMDSAPPNNVTTDGGGQNVQLVCSGDLFVVVNTRNKPFKRDSIGHSRGYFNLGQYNETLEIPSLVQQLDYYLDQGIKNGGLLVSQPDFECKAVGNSSLKAALKSNITLILKDSFPYLTLKQQATTWDGLLNFASEIKQQRVLDNNATPNEYTTLLGFDFESKLSDLSRISYLKTINSTSWSHPPRQSSSTQANGPNGGKPSTATAGNGDDETTGYELPTWFDGWSENVVDNIFNSQFSVNLSSIWNSDVKQHNLVVYRLPSNSERPNRLPSLAKSDEGNSSTSKRDKRDIVAELFIDDRANVDMTMISMKLTKNWSNILMEALNLSTDTGQTEAIKKFKLSRELYERPRRHEDGSDQERAERVLFEHKFSIWGSQYVIQERLQRCKADRHLESASIRSMVSCRLDSDGEEDYSTQYGYVRQLYLTVSSPAGSAEIHCYPYSRLTILNRINSSLRELNEANSTQHHGRHHELANQLDGFVQNYRKLGFYCDAQLKLNLMSVRLGYSWDTVMAVNETSSQAGQRERLNVHQDEEDKADGVEANLVDQYNWLLESVLIGGNRLADGVLMDSYFTAKILAPFWMRDLMSEQLAIQQTYLYKKTFPYVSYRINTQSFPEDPYLFSMSGTVDQTCTERTVPPIQYNIGDKISGTNSILHGSEELFKLVAIDDSFNQTYCTNYNTTYNFTGCMDLFGLGEFVYERDITHQTRSDSAGANLIDSSSIRLADQEMWMFGYGYKHNEYYRHISRWHKIDRGVKLVDYSLDFLETSMPGEPWIAMNFNPKKDLLFGWLQYLKKKLRLKKPDKANAVFIRAFDKAD